AAKQAIAQSAAHVENIVQSQQTVYGINTGFGPLCTTLIDVHDTRKLQENILKSHAVGVGAPIERLLSKLMLILKIHALAKGSSGVRWSTVERSLWHVGNDIIPVVPQQGSVGASGGLAPLAHLFLPLIGSAKVWIGEKTVDTVSVLQATGLRPLSL